MKHMTPIKHWKHSLKHLPNIFKLLNMNPEMEYCASAASMLAEEMWKIVEGFEEVSANL